MSEEPAAEVGRERGAEEVEVEEIPEVVAGLGAERGALPSSGTGPEAVSMESGDVDAVAILCDVENSLRLRIKNPGVEEKFS